LNPETKSLLRYLFQGVSARFSYRAASLQKFSRYRTLWAQAMEGLADEMGRGIRFGQAPSEVAAKKLAIMLALSEITAVPERHPAEEVKGPNVIDELSQPLKKLQAILGSEGGDAP